MIEAISNLISGTPPIAPPANLEKWTNASGGTLEAGVVVKLDGTGGDVDEASTDCSDAFGVTLEEADDGDEIRIQYITSGTVFRGPIDVDSAEVGHTVDLNSDRDGFDGTDEANESGFLVLKVHEDDDGDTDYVEGVFLAGQFI